MFCQYKNVEIWKTKAAKEEFYSTKKTKKICDINIDNIVISKLREKKNNSTYLIEYLDDAMRPLVLILPKTGGYVETFKDEDGDKSKNKDNNLMSFRIDGERLLEKYKTILTKTEDFQNV